MGVDTSNSTFLFKLKEGLLKTTINDKVAFCIGRHIVRIIQRHLDEI